MTKLDWCWEQQVGVPAQVYMNAFKINTDQLKYKGNPLRNTDLRCVDQINCPGPLPFNFSSPFVER